MRRTAGILILAVCVGVTGLTLYHRSKEDIWEAAGVTEEVALSAECCVDITGGEEETTESTADMETGETATETEENTEDWEAVAVSTGTPDSYQLSSFEQSDGSLNIRVLINTSNYGSLLHDSVLITSDEDFIMEGEDQDVIYMAETQVDVTPAFLEQYGGQVTFSGNGSFYLLDVERSCGHPAYPGMIECTNYDGRIGVVNELPLETYLERVLPSEMPDTYGEEALKAQAVCARSYSCYQMLAGKYEKNPYLHTGLFTEPICPTTLRA